MGVVVVQSLWLKKIVTWGEKIARVKEGVKIAHVISGEHRG